ncbi:MAG: hypothetical protein O2803_01665, partial [Chloroflexi bacterium]|nr:hypothetical protein [Chloroflexota bacterium]
MNTKIGKSFGLALLMAIGVVVTMLAMGMFSASGVSADHESGHTLPGQVSEVTFTPGSLNVNAKTNWDVSFGVSSALVAGSGTITIAFPAGVVLPATIDKTRISVGPGTDLVPLTSDPTVTSTTVTLTMPATDPGGGAASGAAVSDIITVSFSQLANLENPAKSGAAGSVSLGTAGKVQTSAQATYANIDVAKSFATTISNSVTSAAEGDTVVVTVGGFTPGLTVSLSGGFVSGSAVVGSDRKATINGTMKGATGTVTATDTAGITAGPSASITIKPTLTATASGKAQDTITLTGKNFTALSNVAGFSSILFGGTALASSANAVTTALKTTSVAHVDKDADGILDDFSLKIKIPSGATKGVNQVKVTDAGSASATANVDVEGRVVTISPTEGPPGTVIVVGGSGFPASIATSANNTISISPVFGSSSVTGLLTGGAGDLPGADQFTIPASATATTIT